MFAAAENYIDCILIVFYVGQTIKVNAISELKIAIISIIGELN